MEKVKAENRILCQAKDTLISDVARLSQENTASNAKLQQLQLDMAHRPGPEFRNERRADPG